MRHDPAGAALIIMLRSLKMPGMAQAVQDLHEQGSPAFEAAMPILSQLLKAEMAEREVRSIAYHMKAARFPAYKDLSAFDFAASEMREALVRQLHRCEFLDGAENVVLIHCPAGYCAAMHERGAALAQGNPTLRRRSAFRQSSITVSACASSQRSNWSTPWSRKRHRARPGGSPRRW